MFHVYSKVIQIHTHTHTHARTLSLFSRLFFHYMLLQDIENSFLCYTVGPCCLSIFIYSSVYLLIPNY